MKLSREEALQITPNLLGKGGGVPPAAPGTQPTVFG